MPLIEIEWDSLGLLLPILYNGNWMTIHIYIYFFFFSNVIYIYEEIFRVIPKENNTIVHRKLKYPFNLSEYLFLLINKLKFSSLYARKHLLILLTYKVRFKVFLC